MRRRMLKKVMRYFPSEGSDYKAMNLLLSELNKCLQRIQIHFTVYYSTIILGCRASLGDTSDPGESR